MTLRNGTILEGKYRIERVLGRGGMGTVYEARHTSIHRRVAVKVLKGVLADDEEMVRRFEREALAASSVKSRHVVEIFDVGKLESGEHYMILEYLDGESLSARLKRLKTMSPAQIFPLVAQLLEGLAAAHAAGIVHRDLKPANVFIAREDGGEMVKVLDFGVSKFSSLGSEGMTQTGALVGTPHYMAPEQTKGARYADHRSDIYAVGAITFRALTGRTPIVAETIHELIAKLITSQPDKIREVAPAIAPEAAAIVDRALDKDPEARFASAKEMADAVESFLRSGAEEGAIVAPAVEEDAPTIATPSSFQEPRVAATQPFPEGWSGSMPAMTLGEAVTADPATLATPSPATIDSRVSTRRSRLPVVLGLSLAVMGLGGLVAVALSGDDESAVGAPVDEPAKPDQGDKAATGVQATPPAVVPSAEDGSPEANPAGEAGEKNEEAQAEEEAAEVEVPPETSKPSPKEPKVPSTGTMPSKGTKAVKPPPVPKPPAPPPPAPGERDFREDI